MAAHDPVDPRVRLAIAQWPDDAPRGAVTTFCSEAGISRKTFYELRKRAVAEGQAAVLEPKSRRPRSSPTTLSDEVKSQAVAVRAALEASGLDHGPISVHDKMKSMGLDPVPSTAALSRVFREAGVARLEPRKRPRAAWRRFVYPAPNACWQLDATEYVLAGGRKCVIFQLIDDHSRYAVASVVAAGETAEAAMAVFDKAVAAHGVPQRLLSDNGIALNPPRRGYVGQLVEHVSRLGVKAMTGKPYRPTTQGKNERFHQTLFRYLDAQPLAGTLADLQAQVDEFDRIYNTERPHQGLPGRVTPMTAWEATEKAEAPRPDPTRHRMGDKPTKPRPPRPRPSPAEPTTQIKRVQANGSLSLGRVQYQVNGRLARQEVIVVTEGDKITVADLQGEILIEHTRPAPGIKYVSNRRHQGSTTPPAPHVPTPPREDPDLQDKQLTACGKVRYDGVTYMVDSRRPRQHVRVTRNGNRIIVTDLDGQILIEHHHPAPGVTYVGNAGRWRRPVPRPEPSPMSRYINCHRCPDAELSPMSWYITEPGAGASCPSAAGSVKWAISIGTSGSPGPSDWVDLLESHRTGGAGSVSVATVARSALVRVKRRQEPLRSRQLVLDGHQPANVIATAGCREVRMPEGRRCLSHGSPPTPSRRTWVSRRTPCTRGLQTRGCPRIGSGACGSSRRPMSTGGSALVARPRPSQTARLTPESAAHALRRVKAPKPAVCDEKRTRVQFDADRRVPWTQPEAPAGISPQAVFLGPDPDGLGSLQVATAVAGAVPSRAALRDLHTARKGRRQITLVVAVTYGDTAFLFGPDPHAATVVLPVEAAQRQLQSALAEPDVDLASERLANFRRAYESTAPGFTNAGLFATHHVMENLPRRPDWSALGEAGRAILTKRDTNLIQALGFRTTRHTAGSLLLSGDGQLPRAVAVLIDATEQFDQRSARLSSSPVAYGLAIAQQQEIPWLVVVRKDQIRLYSGRDGVGVGAKGQAETFFEIDLATIDAEHAALLPLVFSASALAADGSTDQILADSARYATELGKRLRERVYEEIVPAIAVEVAHRLAQQGRALNADGLSTAYQVTLRILFRLLFQAYAEDRGLLPAGRNDGFDANSLKSQGRRLLDAGELEFGDSPILWHDLKQVWLAIDQGQPLWQVPAYNGGLFASDLVRSPDGVLIASIELPDRVLAPALRSLLIDRTEDGTDGLVDFRSLSVREFGTIYEGLLESSLSIADQDLTVDDKGVWVPAKDGEEVHVAAGGVYFHSASGERKATGSYFTPKVVVDHLIERSIVPALTKHLARIEAHLDAGDASAAARDFFDFRVADLAMGSGHFLVAAIDKIEAHMRTFLTRHTVPGVTEELRRLAAVAKEALGTDDVAKLDVDEIALLRRQIARRCIYGLDINLMAVELARLALWIHTFVPGLPMSNLDHGLVRANSLTGIGTIDEAVDALAKVAETTLEPDETNDDDADFDQDVLFGDVQPKLDLVRPKRAKAKTSVGYKIAIRTLLREHLDKVTPLLRDVANASEATKAEVEEAAAHLDAARAASAPIKRLFDAAVAVRLGQWSTHITNEATLRRLTEATEPGEIVAQLRPAHMPVLFPEVFVRDNPGFDVLLGNPPWEELQVEEPKFWLRVRPGLLGLRPAALRAEIQRLRAERADLLPELERETAEVAGMRKVLLTGPYPGLGTGDIDLYNAFAWRFDHLTRNGGAVGVVMPRSLLASAGGSLWRKSVFPSATVNATTLVNRGKWVFDLPDGDRLTIALLAFHTGRPEGTVRMAGPFFSENEFRAGSEGAREPFSRFADASAEATIPDFPAPYSVSVWSSIRKAPRLDERRTGWDFRPVAEFHATNDRGTFDSGLGAGGAGSLSSRAVGSTFGSRRRARSTHGRIHRRSRMRSSRSAGTRCGSRGRRSMASPHR